MSYSLSFSQAIFTVLFVGDKVGQGYYDFVPTKELSASLNIPNPSAVKILGSLASAGIIETREGSRGGVRWQSRRRTSPCWMCSPPLKQQAHVSSGS
jgi:DNA-binding IscR family transcriptional regulator